MSNLSKSELNAESLREDSQLFMGKSKLEKMKGVLFKVVSNFQEENLSANELKSTLSFQRHIFNSLKGNQGKKS